MRAFLSAAALAVVAASASATTHQYYLHADAQRIEVARAYLEGHGLSGVTVRAFRGRLTLGGALPSGAALDALEATLKRETGAISVHH